MNPAIYQDQININAPRAKVWAVLSTPALIWKWADVFGGTPSNFSCDLKEGGELRFWNEDGDGLVGRCLRCVPRAYIEFEYVAAVKHHKIAVLAGDWAEWKGLRNSLSMLVDGEETSLAARSESAESMRGFFAEKWPLALEKIKELAEGTAEAKS